MKAIIIKNATKKKLLSRNVIYAENAVSKVIGLMFSRNQEKSLIFKFNEEKIIALHMFFVFYKIDVLFLDKNKIVVDSKEKFRPFTFYKSKEKAMYAIEFPNGAIKESKTEIGDKIEF